MPTHATLTAITDSRVIGIIRRRTAEEAIADVKRLIRVGVRAIEVSLSTPRAIEVIAAVAPSAGDDLHLGIGTVLAARDVELAKAAGASFIVSPISKAEVIDAARDHGLVRVLGVMTPTECFTAADNGADLLKLFPASLWPLKSMRGLLAALPALRLVPTGGVTLDASSTWLEAGAVAVGLGSSLTKVSSDEVLQRGIGALARPGREERR